MESYSSILLIDDDPINNLINKRLIAKLEIGNKIEEYLEAEKAIERIRQLESDKSILIFLDINMPVMNGWDFLYQYLNQFEGRKDTIVVLSSSIDIQDKNKALGFSCVEGFIEKPLSPEKIKNVLA
ncbi:response regulator, CheY-like [Mariniradius saccharolyticus AK6]|jgi:CheY-like chemotaxis protein|uniref:Response regulator, CheY-like n=1 Tax=Mariniradius saccharolyticus AK6 TaxID=1239962 RepID=M7Y2W2_9BACT|nr:response regulator [Mariniradius saccharolyticus]EMS35097.1 response regulator, CheY-like [Mariniradius saccharolyticus AK6]